jgi:hypothetical protein
MIWNGVEKLPTSLFEKLLDVLDECRGQFLSSVCQLISKHAPDILLGESFDRRFLFEKVGGQSLRQEPFDSPAGSIIGG